MRFRFAKGVSDRLTEDNHFGKKIIFSDEAHFDLGGYVNKQIRTLSLKSELLFDADFDSET